MNNKYQKYIEYIANDIELPYFINMRDSYGLSKKEYGLVLSKVLNQPVTIKGDYVYNNRGNQIYYETSYGGWYKQEYDSNGKVIYSENSNGYWTKREYDSNGNLIYQEYSDGGWYKQEYDSNGKVIYSEDSDGDWYKYEYDSNGNLIYSEDSDGYCQHYIDKQYGE